MKLQRSKKIKLWIQISKSYQCVIQKEKLSVESFYRSNACIQIKTICYHFVSWPIWSNKISKYNKSMKNLVFLYIAKSILNWFNTFGKTNSGRYLLSFTLYHFNILFLIFPKMLHSRWYYLAITWLMFTLFEPVSFPSENLF